MILFKKCRWKNLLSTGNAFTEITLNSHKTTLIVGQNGSGKSTFLDAMTFALYGRPFRSINKPQLLNALNAKEALVELELEVGGHAYLIRRGIKPNLFEIIQDGLLIDQNAASLDYQEMLETNILKMNQKSFSQIVVLGLANFTPFMKLTAQARREVIEDLLDIEIFSVMNTLLRERVTLNKANLGANENLVNLAETKLELHNKHLEDLRQNHMELIDQKQKQIGEYHAQQTETTKQIQTLSERLTGLQLSYKAEEKYRRKAEKLRGLKTTLEQNTKTTSQEVQFYTEHSNCPTCHQGINELFKAEILDQKQARLSELKTGLVNLAKTTTANNAKIMEFARVYQQIMEVTDQIRTGKATFNATSALIDRLRRDINDLEIKAEKAREEVLSRTFQKELAELKHLRDALVLDREIYAIAGQLLKDGGIKARIIKQYIPVLNALINRYLEALDFFVEFEIDEEFKETIRSRFRDEFSYDSFSQGEKLRIDLSLLFAWREVARLRNSMSTNLLILDEVLDSSLDADGTDDFLQIVKSLTKDTNTFIISHKISQADAFDNILTFEKKHNFSRMVGGDNVSV